MKRQKRNQPERAYNRGYQVGVEGEEYADQAGGLSGAPLLDRSTAVVAQLYSHLGDKLPIIGVGGICCGEDAADKIKAGARLVQIYSGFIYRGPELIAEVADAIASLGPSSGGREDDRVAVSESNLS